MQEDWEDQESAPLERVESQEEEARWHIVQIVPLQGTGLPARPTEDVEAATSSSVADGSTPPLPPLRPTRVPSSRPLWGDLDALLAAGPVGGPLRSDAIAAPARWQAAQRRKQLWRRIRRLGLAAIVGAALGTALWWGTGWLHHPLPVHFGSSVPCHQVRCDGQL